MASGARHAIAASLLAGFTSVTLWLALIASSESIWTCCNPLERMTASCTLGVAYGRPPSNFELN